jgi:polyferredoxin
MLVERKIEGDRRERMRAEPSPGTLPSARREGDKHFLWLMIAWWTGGAWVLYFADAPTLVWQLATFQAPAIAYLWIGILTFTTYSLAGFMREQVCTYHVPVAAHPGGADRRALAQRHLSLRPRRAARVGEEGERRAPAACRPATASTAISVSVCPTGVDIRTDCSLRASNAGCASTPATT